MQPVTLTAKPLAERRFYTGMAIIMLFTVFAGFSRSFFLRPLFPAHPSPPESIFLVHGAVFTAWMVLFMVQVSLIARGSAALHRKLGLLGGVLAVAMVVLGVLGALTAASRSTGFVGIDAPPLVFLSVPIFDMVLFPAFVGMALARRHHAQSHKRWMLLATINLLTAAIARIPGVQPLGPLGFFALTDLFVIALAIWDFRSTGRLHPVTLWGGLIFIASQPLRLVVSGTDAWQSFAQWAVGMIQ